MQSYSMLFGYKEPTEWRTPGIDRVLLNVVAVFELDARGRSLRGLFLRSLGMMSGILSASGEIEYAYENAEFSLHL